MDDTSGDQEARRQGYSDSALSATPRQPVSSATCRGSTSICRDTSTSASCSSSRGSSGKKRNRLSLTKQKADKRARKAAAVVPSQREIGDNNEDEEISADAAAATMANIVMMPPTPEKAVGIGISAESQPSGSPSANDAALATKEEESEFPAAVDAPDGDAAFPDADDDEEEEDGPTAATETVDSSSNSVAASAQEDSAATNPGLPANASTSAAPTNNGTTAQQPPLPKKPKPDYMRISVNPDELAAFQLQTRFSTDVNFMKLWRIMSDQGWAHKNARYFSPTGEDLGSSIEVFAYLDRFGMPVRRRAGSRYSTAAAEPQIDINSDEARRGRKLRDNLLEGYFRFRQFTERKKKQKKNDVDVEEEEEEDSSDDNDMGPGLFSLGDSSPEKSPEKIAAATKYDKNSQNEVDNEGGIATRLRKEKQKKDAKIHIEVGANDYMENKGGKFKGKIKPRDEDEEEPNDHIWPDPISNVTAVRDYAQSIAPDGRVMALEDKYVPRFDEWKFLLSTNHSVLLFGFGSKRSLLNDFAQYVLPREGDVLTLDGYDRTINIDDILNVLVQLYLDGHEPRPRSALSREKSLGLGIVPLAQGSPAVVRRAFTISERIAALRPAPLYLVLHNIDGISLRYRNAQDALAMLVAGSAGRDGSRMIRLVSSVDQVNASAVLWTTQTKTCFAWAWKEVHTYRPCFEEIQKAAEERSRKTRHGAQGRSSADDFVGVMRVVQSLGRRHAECLQHLARLQLKLYRDNSKKPGTKKNAFPAISYSEWKDECIRKMCASDDSGLRAILGELTDHGIIVEKAHDRDGTKQLHVPHSDKVLSKIIKFDVAE